MKAVSSKKYNIPVRVEGVGLLIRRKDIATEYLLMQEDVKYIDSNGLATVYRCSDDGISRRSESFLVRSVKGVLK